jgi:hypothetical protein
MSRKIVEFCFGMLNPRIVDENSGFAYKKAIAIAIAFGGFADQGCSIDEH